jgi:predicted DCC family thiol-disulfide oxidoreductase YuxK
MGPQHLLLYDGVCGLCNGTVQFVLPRDKSQAFDLAPLQSATGREWMQRFGRNPDELDTFAVVTNYASASPALLTKARAALFVASSIGFPWRVLTAARIVPTFVLNSMYDFVARRRYGWFGQSEVCMLPPPEYRARFIDL